MRKILLLLLTASPAGGFRVQVFKGLRDSFTLRLPGTTEWRRFHYFARDRSDFLECDEFVEGTARWNATGSGAREDGGPPGLDGGIEFFIRDTLCEGINGNNLKGQAGRAVACDELEGAVGRGLDTWSLRHPKLYFRRVWNESRAELLIGSEAKHELSDDAHSEATPRDAIAYAQLGLVRSKAGVISSTGRPVPGFAIAHAWIRFNPEHCFYVKVSSMCLDDRAQLRFYLGYAVSIAGLGLFFALLFLRLYGSYGRYQSDRQKSALALSTKLGAALCVMSLVLVAWSTKCGPSLGCFNFETILRHEVGHVLGFDHPDVDGAINLDSDHTDGNHIPIDAHTPCKGLQLVRKRYWKSIMVSHGSRTSRRHKLAHDDLAALHFLYPTEAAERIKGKEPVPLEWWPEDKLHWIGAKAAEAADARRERERERREHGHGRIYTGTGKWLGSRDELLQTLAEYRRSHGEHEDQHDTIAAEEDEDARGAEAEAAGTPPSDADARKEL